MRCPRSAGPCVSPPSLPRWRAPSKSHPLRSWVYLMGIRRCMHSFLSVAARWNSGTNVPKSQFPARKHLSSSPESASRGWFSRARERNAQDEAEAGGFSPRWDRFGDICSLSPLTSASPGDPPERRKKPALRGGTSPAFQRCSPITPAPNLGQPRCALESCSDGGPPDAQEDDTPEILRDDCAAPHKGPKARSPNKKRVSPPHKYPDEMIPGSSRSGKLRKFVLRSMPSFPSLTPYSNASKGHGT